MFKSIVKEVMIIILLIIAILLILGIVLYKYNPTSKKTPNKVEAYVLSEEMEQELKETIEATNTQNIIKTYRVNAQDLKVYQQSNDYDKGKKDPFSEVINTGNGNTQGNISGATGNSSNSGSGNGSQGGQILNQVGK